MAILVKNHTVRAILDYLNSQRDEEAQELYQQLLEDLVEHEQQEMITDGELAPETKGGAYII